MLLCQIFLKLLVQELVAVAHPLKNLALLHDIQPRNETQGELSSLTEAEAEEVMLEELIGVT